MNEVKSLCLPCDLQLLTCILDYENNPVRITFNVNTRETNEEEKQLLTPSVSDLEGKIETIYVNQTFYQQIKTNYLGSTYNHHKIN